MKKTRLLLASVVLASTGLVGCGNKNPKEDEKQHTDEVKDEILELISVSERKSFNSFKENIKEKSNVLEDFNVKTNPYEVGVDGVFKLAPTINYYAEDPDDPENPMIVANQDGTEYETGWDVKVLDASNSSVIPAEDYVFDSKKCEIDFNNRLVGKTLKISVSPKINVNKKVTEEKIAGFTKETVVKVSDGYNVYSALELNYFDDRDDANPYSMGSGETDDTIVPILKFKQDHGLSPTYHPTALFLHNDISFTTADCPAENFYSESDFSGISLTQEQKELALGSAKDYFYLLLHTGSGNIRLNGNYFKLDFSKIPLVVRERGTNDICGNTTHVSHSSFFKITGGNATFENLNITGNAKNYVAEGDEKNAGGHILVKAGVQAASVTMKNSLLRQNFICALTEKVDESLNPVNFVMSDIKASDNYNSFLYNWGGKMNISRSVFSGCGGPVIIQDHTGVDDTGPWESSTGNVVYGFAPVTTFTDCVFDNYVHGAEPWFEQFQAAALSETIKQMSDLYALKFGKSFVTDEQKKAGLYTALSMSNKKSYFNFIALNKSSAAQDITQYPVCGEVKFVDTGVTTKFNYAQPTDPANYSDHLSLRNINKQGGPVFETAGGIGAVLDAGNPSIVSIREQSVMSGIGQLYDFAQYLYTAVNLLGKSYPNGYTSDKAAEIEQLFLKINNEEEYLDDILAYLGALMVNPIAPSPSQVTFNMAVCALAGLDLTTLRNQVAALVSQGLINSYDELPTEEYKEQVDKGIYAELHDQAVDQIYPLFRSFINAFYMLQTGKQYLLGVGLVDLCDLYRGIKGYGSGVEVSISEAVKNLATMNIPDALASTLSRENAFAIVELAYNFVSDNLNPAQVAAFVANVKAKSSQDSTEHFGDLATPYTALYYNGMMLVFGLQDLA